MILGFLLLSYHHLGPSYSFKRVWLKKGEMAREAEVGVMQDSELKTVSSLWGLEKERKCMAPRAETAWPEDTLETAVFFAQSCERVSFCVELLQ